MSQRTGGEMRDKKRPRAEIQNVITQVAEEEREEKRRNRRKK